MIPTYRFRDRRMLMAFVLCLCLFFVACLAPASVSAPLVITPTRVVKEKLDLHADLLQEPYLLQVAQSHVSQLLVDDTHVYWVSDDTPSILLRRPIQGSNASPVVTTTFDAGVVNFIQPLKNERWLIFGDAAMPQIGVPWKLRALNLSAAQEILVYASEDGAAFFQGADLQEDWLVFTLLEPSRQHDCVESVLFLYNLANQQTQELDRVCAEQTYLWASPRLSGDYIAIEQDLPDSKGGGNNIFLFDRRDKRFVQVTNDNHSSMPALEVPWLAWKDSLRYSEANQTILHNLQTGERRVLSIGFDNTFLFQQRWLLWRPRPLEPLYVYNFQTDKLWIVASPTENENIEAIAVHNHQVFWWRNFDLNKATGEGMIEGRVLPP